MKKFLFNKRFSYFDLFCVATVTICALNSLWIAIPAVLIIGGAVAIGREEK